MWVGPPEARDRGGDLCASAAGGMFEFSGGVAAMPSKVDVGPASQIGNSGRLWRVVKKISRRVAAEHVRVVDAKRLRISPGRPHCRRHVKSRVTFVPGVEKWKKKRP
jgi:hypothetical protein